MNNFLTPLDIRYVDKRFRQILAPFVYRLDSPDGEEFVNVPVGFLTDFASIPGALRTFWPSPGGPWDKPAVIHDALYQRGYVERADGSKRIIERAEADEIFKEAMNVTETSWYSRRLIYRGVRVGGRGTWNAYREAERPEAPPPLEDL